MAVISLDPQFLAKAISECRNDYSDPVIGAAVSIDRKGEIKHAALFLRFSDESRIFHYTGTEVLLEDADTVSHYYYKGLVFILPELIPSFVAQCELIEQKAQPAYGYFYTGSLYNDKGDFIDPRKFPQTMTCVGFSLNVLKHFLGDDNLLHYTDWDSSTVSESYLEEFYKKVKKERSKLTLLEFRKNVRRLLPLEYFTAACSDSINVRKKFTDANNEFVRQSLFQKRLT